MSGSLSKNFFVRKNSQKIKGSHHSKKIVDFRFFDFLIPLERFVQNLSNAARFGQKKLSLNILLPGES